MLKTDKICYNVVENNVEKNILNNVSLKFEYGKIYVITGPNGSGKSTFVKILMGISKQSSGEIFLDNQNVSSLPINERAKLGMGFAFQQPVTFKGLRVKELLDVASGKTNDFNSLCDYLATVGLCAKDYINRPLDDKLSGGELKRIELAMVLSRKTALNIFDEPEAGIDLWSFDQLTKIFSSLKGSCNIIVSHQRKILEIADEIILLKDGQVECVGTLEKVLPLLENKTCHKLRGENG